jgi:hypothetical protein
MLSSGREEASVPRWRVYVELQTSSLADDAQLGALTSRLATGAGQVEATPSVGSLGSRYSVAVTAALEAADAEVAQTQATQVLEAACGSVGIITGKVLARGIIAGPE